MGSTNLRAHNLLTYKSKQEPLDGWALDELIGHYVNYRKLISPESRLLPESDVSTLRRRHAPSTGTGARAHLATHRLAGGV